MQKDNERVFTKSTVIIGIILTIISGIGSWLKPDSTLIIIAIAGLIIALIVITDRFNQINDNSREIEELKKSLNIEKRLNVIEKDIAEQKGMLFAIGEKMNGNEVDRLIMVIVIIVFFLLLMYVILKGFS